MDVAVGHMNLQLNVPHTILSPVTPCPLLFFFVAAAQSFGLKQSGEF